MGGLGNRLSLLFKENMSFPFPGPVPAYSNVPIQPDNYAPRRFVISAITLGQTTTVTTTEDLNYVVGQLVRLIIPPSFGCRQLNEVTGYVLSIPDVDQVVISIDSSRNVDPYIASSATTQAQILAIGDINSGNINSSGRVNLNVDIPGSFINVSP